MISTYGSRKKEEFKFKYHCKLKIEQDELSPFCQLIAASSKRGMVFVGGMRCIKIIVSNQLLNSIDAPNIRENLESFPCCTIPLPESPSHLDVNCDEKYLAVVCNVEDCPVLYMYDIDTLFNQELQVVREIHISSSQNTKLLQLTWNPGVENTLACCFSDGSAGIYTMINTDGQFEINTLPPGANSTCLCWSPKGKQIIVGMKNGELIQYKMEFKAVKKIPAPELSKGSVSVTNVKWISNFQYIASYRNLNDDESTPNVVVINTPKNQPVSYVDFEELCLISRNPVNDRYYFIHQPIWNIIIVASASGIEIQVLGLAEDGVSWNLLLTNDKYNVYFPSDDNFNPYFPLGVAIDYSLTDTVQTEDGEQNECPSMPLLWIILDTGIILCYRVIDEQQQAQICAAPEMPLTDDILQTYFTEKDSDPSVENISETASNCSSFEQLDCPSDVAVDEEINNELDYESDNFEIVEVCDHDEPPPEKSDNEKPENVRDDETDYVEKVEDSSVVQVKQELLEQEEEAADVKISTDGSIVFRTTHANHLDFSGKQEKPHLIPSSNSILADKTRAKEFIDMVLYANYKMNPEHLFPHTADVNGMYSSVHYRDKISSIIQDFVTVITGFAENVDKCDEIGWNEMQVYEIKDRTKKLNEFSENLNDVIASLDTDVNELNSHLLKLFKRYEDTKRIYRTSGNNRFAIMTNYELKSIHDDAIRDLERQIETLNISATQLNRSLDEAELEANNTMSQKEEKYKMVYNVLLVQMDVANNLRKKLETLESRIPKLYERKNSSFAINKSLNLNELKSTNDGYSQLLRCAVRNDKKRSQMADWSPHAKIERNSNSSSSPPQQTTNRISFRTSYKFDARKIQKLKETFAMRKFNIETGFDNFAAASSIRNNADLVVTTCQKQTKNDEDTVVADRMKNDMDYLNQIADRIVLIEDRLRESPISRLIIEFIAQTVYDKSSCFSEEKKNEKIERLKLLVQQALNSIDENIAKKESKNILSPLIKKSATVSPSKSKNSVVDHDDDDNNNNKASLRTSASSTVSSTFTTSVPVFGESVSSSFQTKPAADSYNVGSSSSTSAIPSATFFTPKSSYPASTLLLSTATAATTISSSMDAIKVPSTLSAAISSSSINNSLACESATISTTSSSPLPVFRASTPMSSPASIGIDNNNIFGKTAPSTSTTSSSLFNFSPFTMPNSTDASSTSTVTVVPPTTTAIKLSSQNSIPSTVNSSSSSSFIFSGAKALSATTAVTSSLSALQFPSSITFTVSNLLKTTSSPTNFTTITAGGAAASPTVSIAATDAIPTVITATEISNTAIVATVTSATATADSTTSVGSSLFDKPLFGNNIATTIANTTTAASTISSSSSLFDKPLFGNSSFTATAGSTTTSAGSSVFDKPLFGNSIATTAATTDPTTSGGSSLFDKPVFGNRITTTTATAASATSGGSSLFDKPLFGNSNTAAISSTTTAPTASDSSTTLFNGLSFGDKKPTSFSIFSGTGVSQSTTTAMTIPSDVSVFSGTSLFGSLSITPSASTSTTTSSASRDGNTTTAVPSADTTATVSNNTTSVADNNNINVGKTDTATIATTDSKTSFFSGISSAGSIFGGTSSATTNSSTSIFGGGNVSFGTSIFGNASQSGSSTPTTSVTTETGKSDSLFSKPLFGTPSSSFQGVNNTSGTFQTSSSIFGGSGTPIFGSANNNTSASSFGTTTAFGSGGTGLFSQTAKTGHQSLFGSPPTFGSNSFGAQPAFGKTASAFGGAPAFGSAPAFGGSSTFGAASSTFGSPGKVFGQTNPVAPGTFGNTGQQSTTFENLASENTITFGNLAAQQSTQPTFGGSIFGTPPPQTDNKPSFGGNSFSSWR